MFGDNSPDANTKVIPLNSWYWSQVSGWAKRRRGCFIIFLSACLCAGQPGPVCEFLWVPQEEPRKKQVGHDRPSFRAMPAPHPRRVQTVPLSDISRTHTRKKERKGKKRNLDIGFERTRWLLMREKKTYDWACWFSQSYIPGSPGKWWRAVAPKHEKQERIFRTTVLILEISLSFIQQNT